jgi:hypothetical protein
MNTDQSTTVISDQAASELAATVARTLQAKSAWHRPSLTRIEIKRTMAGSGILSDCSTEVASTICS